MSWMISAALQNMFKDSLSDQMFTVRSWQEMLKIGKYDLYISKRQ